MVDLLKPLTSAVWQVWWLRLSPDALPGAGSFLLVSAVCFALSGAIVGLTLFVTSGAASEGAIKGIVVWFFLRIALGYYVLPALARYELGSSRAKKVSAAMLLLFSTCDGAVIVASMLLFAMLGAGPETSPWIAFMHGASGAVGLFLSCRMYLFAATRLPRRST